VTRLGEPRVRLARGAPDLVDQSLPGPESPQVPGVAGGPDRDEGRGKAFRPAQARSFVPPTWLMSDGKVRTPAMDSRRGNGAS